VVEMRKFIKSSEYREVERVERCGKVIVVIERVSDGRIAEVDGRWWEMLPSLN
jgi:nitrate reductase NapAB chaperone NapD